MIKKPRVLRNINKNHHLCNHIDFMLQAKQIYDIHNPIEVCNRYSQHLVKRWEFIIWTKSISLELKGNNKLYLDLYYSKDFSFSSNKIVITSSKVIFK